MKVEYVWSIVMSAGNTAQYTYRKGRADAQYIPDFCFYTDTEFSGHVLTGDGKGHGLNSKQYTRRSLACLLSNVFVQEYGLTGFYPGVFIQCL